ncbi:mucin-5AC [Anopheles ziemanni]|uniref:mucin-5AC n=1 Tax=Anopheles coustani TaxID=139045 RepID=UPI0026596A7F|nr:mucin-5AC [Anopheles coustani]XP_058175620.1 mucin-5AC [Anopheles ziemanni]
MHINMALLQNICKFNGCALEFQSLDALIHHIEDTHIIDYIPLLERAQPACLPLSCILPYNPQYDSVAPAASGASGAVNGADTLHRCKTGVAAVWGSAAHGVTMTVSGGNANNQPTDAAANSTATSGAVNGVNHSGAATNGTAEQNGLGGNGGTLSEVSKNSLNQPTGTADLKRKIAIKHHSYSISSSNRSTTPTGSELDDDDMMVSESEDSNDSWTTEEFSSEFIMRYGSRRHSASGTGNGSNSSNEKPFACPVPGCKKRYKNVNGIKYHSKNGHKKDGNRVRKGFKCFCGKSYKTNQRLKIHNMLSHGPGWTNAATAGNNVSGNVSTSSGSIAAVQQSNGSAVTTGPSASASETDGSVAAFETIPLPLPVAAVSSQSRASISSISSGSTQSTNTVSIPTSSWEGSYTLDFTSTETSGIGTSPSIEQDQLQEQSTLSSSTSGISTLNSSPITNGSTMRTISSTFPSGTRSFLHLSSSVPNTSSQNASQRTITPPPPPTPATPTLATLTPAAQSGFTNATKRTATTTAAATLMISPIPTGHGVTSGGCFASSTPISSPVSIKYDSLGILTPATSPKLLATNISPENGQQLLAAAGGASTPAAVQASPLPPASTTTVVMPALNVSVGGNATGGGGTSASTTVVSVASASAIATTPTSGVAQNGEPVGIALVVSSIGGCGEMNNTNSTVTTTSTSNNNAVVLSASTATSQLYAEET